MKQQHQWVAALLACVTVCMGTASPNALWVTSGFAASPTRAIYAVAQLQTQPLATPTPLPTHKPIGDFADKPTLTNTAPPTQSTAPQPPTAHVPYTEVALIADTGAPPKSGSVTEQHFTHGGSGQFFTLEHGSVKNITERTNASLQEEIAKGMPFDIDPTSTEPQVLIVHSHATETYRPYEGLYFDLDDSARTTDKTRNMCAVGQVMTDTLNAAGIVTLHDTTLNDYPSYNASYDNSRAVVQQYLRDYPSIAVVLDVHRDAIGTDDLRYAPVTTVDGKKAAQVMIVAGCDNGGNIELPDCMQNLRFATAWESALEADTPGISRPMLFSYRHYNQDLRTGSLLIEVGGHGNTINEALYGAQLAAESLAKLLKE